MNADTQLQQGLVDRYRIERELGRGGMARVYLAYDLKHQRRVALKHLAPEVAQAMGTERFEREIRLAAGLQHPHICSVYDSGEVDGLFWFTIAVIIWFFVELGCLRGTVGSNDYGPDPLGGEVAMAR